MVGLAPRGRDGAAREGAALVAGDEGFALVGREDPGGPADVQDPALGAEEDGDDVRVAGDLADGAGGDGSGEQQRAGVLGCPAGRSRNAGRPVGWLRALPVPPVVPSVPVPRRASRSR